MVTSPKYECVFNFKIKGRVSSVGDCFYHFWISVIISSIASGFPLKINEMFLTFLECLARGGLLKVNRLTAENWLLLLLKIVCSSSDESSPSSVKITSGSSVTSSCCKLLVSSYSLVSNGSGFQDLNWNLFFWVFEEFPADRWSWWNLPFSLQMLEKFKFCSLSAFELKWLQSERFKVKLNLHEKVN